MVLGVMVEQAELEALVDLVVQEVPAVEAEAEEADISLLVKE